MSVKTVEFSPFQDQKPGTYVVLPPLPVFQSSSIALPNL